MSSLTSPYKFDWRHGFESRFGIQLQWFGRYAGYPEWSIELSRLAGDKISFYYVETERCWVVINGVRHDLKAGQLLVIRGGEEFLFGHDPSRPHVSLSAALAIEHGGEANNLLHYEFERIYTLKNPRRYVREFEKLLGLFRKHRSTRDTPAVPTALKSQYEMLPYRDILVSGAILKWVSDVLEMLRPSVSSKPPEEGGPLERVLTAEIWAIANLSKSITLAEWAHAVGVHPDYLARLFRKHTGKRPIEWLNERRLQEVERLLTGTSKPLAQIAEACGFDCPFYLSRLFKKRFGTPPGRYRKAQLSSKPKPKRPPCPRGSHKTVI
jgi:AraC-like DNA-binding protein